MTLAARRFLVAVEPGTARAAFGVIVPSLPGCFAAGDTLPEAMADAAEAIHAHLAIRAEAGSGDALPVPPATLASDPDLAGLCWYALDVLGPSAVGFAPVPSPTT